MAPAGTAFGDRRTGDPTSLSQYSFRKLESLVSQRGDLEIVDCVAIDLAVTVHPYPNLAT